jgi:cyclin-C
MLHSPTRDIILQQLPSENGERSPHQPTYPPEQTTPTPQPRRSSRQAHQASTPVEQPKKPQDPISFLAELNVSLPLIATVSQEIISLYTLWDRYKEDDAPKTSREQGQSPFTGSASGSTSPTKRSVAGSRSASVNAGTSNAGTPMNVAEDSAGPGWSEGSYVTPAMLSVLLQRMREARLADISHPATGRPVAINKMLERTQAAG